MSSDIDALNAAVEEGKSTIMMLTEEVATLSKEVADLDSSMAEATKMRTAEKAKNKNTVEDSEATVTIHIGLFFTSSVRFFCLSVI